MFFFGSSFAVIRLTRRATLVAWSSPLSCLIIYFLSCHLRSIAFSSQHKYLDLQHGWQHFSAIARQMVKNDHFTQHMTNYKIILNTSFSKMNMIYLFQCHCHCHCQGQTMWVCRGDYRGDSSAASVVIESPFVGALVNFGELRGREEALLQRVRHSSLSIFIFPLQISSSQIS